MKKILIVILVLLSSTYVFADKFIVNNVSVTSKHIKAYNKDSGKFLWESMNKTVTLESKGNSYIKIVEDGKGLWGSDNEQRTWHSEAVYLYKDGTIVPQNSMLVFKNNEGELVESLSVDYYPADKKVVADSSKNGKKEFEYKEGMVDKNALGVCFMGFDYLRKNDFYFPMLTNEPAYYGMTLINKGIDIQTVEGVTIPCYKVQMVPDLGMLGFVGAFIPKTYFWYTADPSHEFVRYEGLESGLNTPYIVMLGVK